jgi:putative drug exporter of the RND superfamily
VELRRLAGVPAGRWSKWVVVLAWVAIAVALGPLGNRLTSVQKNDDVSYLPRNAESTRANAQLQRFPDAKQVVALVVYRRDSGLTRADRAKAEADRVALARRFLGGAQAPPLIASPDHKALVLSLPLRTTSTTSEGGTQLVDAVDQVRSSVGHGRGGLRVAVTGPAGYAADSIKVFQQIDTKLLLATALVVALLLILTYRSPWLWLVPLLTVGLAYQSAAAAVYLLARYAGVTVNGLSQGILTVLVFGASTDYALLLVARYREELRRHQDKHQAMRAALGSAGPAILASGATVTIGLLCLLVAELNSTRGLGPVGAVGIIAALAAMLTLLPAVLVIFGRGLFWPFVPHFGSVHPEEASLWGRVGVRIQRRPRLVWAVTALILAVMAVGLVDTRTGLNQDQAFRGQPDSVVGQQLLAASFPSGATAPISVVARAATAPAVLEAVRATPGIASARLTGRAGDLVEITATETATPGSAASTATVQRLRQQVHAIPGAQALVGGAPAIDLDVNNATAHDRTVIIPLVLAVVLVILAVLLRAIVAPLLLIATVILSLAAALGVSMVVDDKVFGFAGSDVSVPLYAFIFLVALGIDYNIFLMTRVREESARLGTRAGALRALAVTGGVITSAGLVLAATFSVLAVLPLVTMIEIGFVVAFGVLLDTLVVRSLLVPALTFDLDRRIWWPSALSRRPASPLPEGSSPESHPARTGGGSRWARASRRSSTG